MDEQAKNHTRNQEFYQTNFTNQPKKKIIYTDFNSHEINKNT